VSFVYFVTFVIQAFTPPTLVLTGYVPFVPFVYFVTFVIQAFMLQSLLHPTSAPSPRPIITGSPNPLNPLSGAAQQSVVSPLFVLICFAKSSYIKKSSL
jgi:hypothetical protein